MLRLRLKCYPFSTGGSLRKKHALIGGILSLILISLLCLLFYDLEGVDTFRTTQDRILATEDLDLRGLKDLHASGGHIPRFEELQKQLPANYSKRVILDLTTEAHGYIKGIPANYFGYHLSSPKLKHIPRRLIYLGTLKKRRELIIPEAKEAKKHNFGYKNIVIGSKFITTDKKVDKFLGFFDKLPQGTWVHFHCVQGKGRTSMALVMLDIMKNAPEVSLNNIVKRQYLLGSVNLFDTTLWKKSKYSLGQLKARKKFIENFYTFICQRKAGGIQLWSEWRNARQAASKPTHKKSLRDKR